VGAAPAHIEGVWVQTGEAGTTLWAAVMPQPILAADLPPPGVTIWVAPKALVSEILSICPVVAG
jgi:hypothetical protein